MTDFDTQFNTFGECIERELREGRLNFPTVLDLSLRIQRVADDPDASLDDIAAIARAEPVLSAKAVRMANTVLMNPYGAPVTHIGDAVRRIGLDALRGLALSVAAEQVAQDFRSRQLKLIATGLWMHTVDVACWASVIARDSRSAHPDAAMFAGMMVDIGQFFLLARATDYPALEEDMQRFADFVAIWHAPIGRAIMELFGLPQSVLDAYREPLPENNPWPPTSLPETLRLARVLTESPNPFDKLVGPAGSSLGEHMAPTQLDTKALQPMMDSVQNGRRQLLASLAG